jgi:hypothetical protein
MRPTSRVLGVVVLALVVSVGWAGPSGAQTFSSSCDRFEVDGNTFGPFDGVADFVDEFDNGTIAPDWVQLLGTSVEAGSVVTLRDPGTPIPLPGFNTVTSNIENETGLLDGSGNFTLTAYWVPTIPATDTQFHLQMYGIGSVIEAAGLSFGNLSAAAAAGGAPGSLVGPAISQQLTYIGSPAPPQQFATVAVNPAAITGRIVFRITFDDATNMITSSFSLDGGTTFQSPFPSIHIFNGLNDTDILLGAAAGIPTPPPPPPPPPTQQKLSTQLFLVKNPGAPAQRKIIYKVKEIASDDYVFGDPTFTGATLNVSLDTQSQCFFMLPGLWSHIGGGYKYSDPHGAYGPVKIAQMRRTNAGTFTLKAIILGRGGPIDIVPPVVIGATNLAFGAEQQYCGWTSGGAIGPSDDKTFKAKNAPAPPACYVAACSPSGAFLDADAGAP